MWIDSESDVTHGQLQAAGAIRPSWCFNGKGVRFWSLGKQFSESEARHGQLRRQPSFTAMVFQCSRGVRVGSLGKQFGASFLWIQKVTLGVASCRPQAPSFTAIVFQCRGGIRFGNLGKQFRASFAWIQKVTLGTASCRPQAPSVLHCHCVSVWRRGPFWELGPQSRCQHGAKIAWPAPGCQASAFKSGRRPTGQPVSLPKAFGGH